MVEIVIAGITTFLPTLVKEMWNFLSKLLGDLFKETPDPDVLYKKLLAQLEVINKLKIESADETAQKEFNKMKENFGLIAALDLILGGETQIDFTIFSNVIKTFSLKDMETLNNSITDFSSLTKEKLEARQNLKEEGQQEEIKKLKTMFGIFKLEFIKISNQEEGQVINKDQVDNKVNNFSQIVEEIIKDSSTADINSLEYIREQFTLNHYPIKGQDSKVETQSHGNQVPTR